MANATFYNEDNSSTLPKSNNSSSSPVGGKALGKVSNIISMKKNKTKNKGKKRVFKFLGAGFGLVVTIVLVVLAAGYFFAFKPAYALLSNVNQLEEDFSNIKLAMAQRDLVVLPQRLDETETHLNELRTARDENIGWAKDFGPTSEYFADSDHFIDSALIMLDAGREAVELVKPFADAGGFKVSEEQEVVETGLADAFAQWIAIMPEVAEDSDAVLNKLAEAGEVLAKVDASKYPEEFRGTPVRPTIESAQKTLVLLNDAAPDIKNALISLPELMGVGTGEKRYMIIMQNDKELRATGGFWTYFSTFKLRNALLTSDFTSYGTYNIDFTLETIDPFYTFPKVPGAYERHLKVERMFARDANISPDLPTAIDQFSLFWELAMPLAPAQFKPVDGFITIDTVVLEELLEVTGPVTLNGITYSSETVTLELEKIASLALKEQANRKKILGDLMERMLVNVFESDSNLWPKLIEKGIDLAMRKHIQAFVYDEQGQALLEKYNLAGRIIDPVEGDYAFLASANLGGGKTNGWFVNKVVDHTLEKEGDRWVRTVTANYTYGEKAPEYDPFIVRYQDWVRLYVPLGSELISVEGSEDITEESEERNKTVFDGYITLGPGETKAITFKYYLPEGVVSGDTYNLYIQKQSGIDMENHTVTVNGKTENIELKLDKKLSVGL